MDTLTAVTAHVTKHVGQISYVWHEVLSDSVHIDVHVAEPTARRPYFVLVTTGMSQKPMRTPREVREARFAEVLLCLPDTWPLRMKPYVLDTDCSSWPVRLLRQVAQYPHHQQTWLYRGHSICWSNPPQPLDATTRMNSVLLLRPRLIPGEAHTVMAGKGRTVFLWGVYPLYPEELDLKIEEGADRLEKLFQQYGVTELLNPTRPSVARPN